MGGREQGSRDFSASHSSKHDINNTDYFRLPFMKVWNWLAASAEAWPRAGWLLPPGFLSWGAQPGVAAGRCVLRQAARLENTSIFPLLILPGIFWDVWGSWFVSQRFEGVFCCPGVICIPAVPKGCSQAGVLAVLGAVQT